MRSPNTLFLMIPTLLFCPRVGAQTLDLGNSTPAIGMIHTVNDCDYVSPTAAGPAQVWDFSDLTANTTWASSVLDPTDISGAASFPDATMAEESDGAYAFYTYSSTGVDYQGMAIPDFDVLMTYQDPERILVFPCSINTTWEDLYGGAWNSSGGVEVTTTGTLTATADAQGTLLMPYGTVSNVLRVTTTTSHADVFSNQGAIQYDMITHDFYKPGIPFPLVSFVQQDIVGMGNEFHEQNGSWLPGDFVGLSEAVSNAIGISVLPNPASHHATIIFGSQGGTLQLAITDATGRLVRSERLEHQPFGIGKHELALTGLPAGLYTVRLTDALGQHGVKKLIVE